MAIDTNGGSLLQASAPAWSDGDWTWCGWVNAPSVNQGVNSGIFANGQDQTNHFQVDTDAGNPGNYRCKSVGPPGTDNILFGPVVANTWVHLALVRSASAPSRVLYQDGVVVTTSGFDFDETTQTWDLYRIGQNRSSSSLLNFDGLFEDFRVYRGRLLTAADVATIYASRGHDGIVDGLAARWMMNEGSPGTAVSTLVDSRGAVTVLASSGSPLYVPSELNLRRRVA